MRYRTLIAFILISVSTLAQTKGYMGKRFIVSVNGMYMPAAEPTARKVDGFKLNATHTAGIEFAAGNETTLCLSAGYFKTGLSFSERSYTNSHSGIFYDGNQEVPITVAVKQYSVGIKKFRRRAVAPLGLYLKWEAIYQQGTVNFNKDNFFTLSTSSSGVSSREYPASGSLEYKSAGASFAIGFQRIFYDCLVLDYGLRGAICMDLNSYSVVPIEAEFMPKAYARVLGHQLLNFRIGIGFLAF
ncbi:MAG: hypothetical protein JWO44_2295 [Bacteroidetes bacterium]|nr:hypothetical protein [Bacteroidota bacterium]